jgi:murein DD-endopeptidase MepM/ murein hydrolase activator NlpD
VAQARGERTGGVVLDEQQVADPLADTGALVARQEQQRHRDGQPVRRQDAQRAPPQVVAGSRCRAAFGGRAEQRPGEQEARQDEEDRHADVEAGEGPAQQRRGVPAGPEGDVGADDRRGRERSRAVQARVGTFGTRRRPALHDGRCGHGLPFVRTPAVRGGAVEE